MNPLVPRFRGSAVRGFFKIKKTKQNPENPETYSNFFWKFVFFWKKTIFGALFSEWFHSSLVERLLVEQYSRYAMAVMALLIFLSLLSTVFAFISPCDPIDPENCLLPFPNGVYIIMCCVVSYVYLYTIYIYICVCIYTIYVCVYYMLSLVDTIYFANVSINS